MVNDGIQPFRILMMKTTQGDKPESFDTDISVEMLAAGAEVIVEKWGICGLDIAPDLARDVFHAMCAQKDREQN